MTDLHVRKSFKILILSLNIYFISQPDVSCVTHSAHLTHPDDGLDEGRLPFVFVVHQVDVGPVSERFSHDGQVSGFRGFAEQRPGGQLSEVLGVRRLRLRLPTRVLRHLAL